MHYYIMYIYHPLRCPHMSRRCNLPIFRELTPKFLKTYNNILGRRKYTYVVVSMVQIGLVTYKGCQIPEQLGRYLIGNL